MRFSSFESSRTLWSLEQPTVLLVISCYKCITRYYLWLSLSWILVFKKRLAVFQNIVDSLWLMAFLCYLVFASQAVSFNQHFLYLVVFTLLLLLRLLYIWPDFLSFYSNPPTVTNTETFQLIFATSLLRGKFAVQWRLLLTQQQTEAPSNVDAGCVWRW